MSTENIKSSFNKNAENWHAKWYVQTLKSYNIKPDIVSQLTWKKNRQDEQKINKSKCWKFTWKEQQKCIYRYHYHSRKWYNYAEKSYKIYEYYKNYFNN